MRSTRQRAELIQLLHFEDSAPSSSTGLSSPTFYIPPLTWTDIDFVLSFKPLAYGVPC